MADRAVISVHASPRTVERLARLSDATRRSRSWLANDAIERYLREEEVFLEAVARGRDQAFQGQTRSSAEAKAVLRERLSAGLSESDPSGT